MVADIERSFIVLKMLQSHISHEGSGTSRHLSTKESSIRDLVKLICDLTKTTFGIVIETEDD